MHRAPAVLTAASALPGWVRKRFCCSGRTGIWRPLAAALLPWLASPGTAQETPPALAVVVIVDQFRADYLERFRPYFSEGGLARFSRDGVVYANAHYRHALTATAPGHATLLTGVHAERHGIINNEWKDPVTLVDSAAVDDSEQLLVGAARAVAPGPGGLWAGRRGASPHRLLATTVGDQLKLRYGPAARVIGIGQKDRSPILMGGRLADAAYWLHDGHFVTSTFYRPDLPDWVAAFNAEERVDRAFGTRWEHLLPVAAYDACQGPDDAPGEDDAFGLGVTFPHPLHGGETKPGNRFYNAYRHAPIANELVADFALLALRAEQLGADAIPDLLCLGFSQLDVTGHAYGPDSHEVMDSIVRLDRVLEKFFAVLDEQVGRDRYVVVLSGDHGVAPLPERVSAYARGLNAGRYDAPAMDRALEEALNGRFGALPEGLRWTLRDGYGYRLIPPALESRGVEPAAAAVVVKETLLRSPQIGCAWTHAELASPVPPGADPSREAWRRSFHPDRSPDVMFSFAPYTIDRRPLGTNHGSPHLYDTHVPLAWFGAGVPQGHHLQRVGTDQLAPTLARRLGVPPPPEARADPLF